MYLLYCCVKFFVYLPRTRNLYFFLLLNYLNLHTVNILEENARLDRIEHHLKLMKETTEITSESIHKISNALIGNEYTGGIGIVHTVHKIKIDVENNKDEIAILKDNMGLIKWFASGVGGLVIAIIIYLLGKI